MGNEGKEGYINLSVKVDKRGRITLAKWFREMFKIKPDSVITIKVLDVEVIANDEDRK